MREILFKAKRIDNGKWVYGFYCCGAIRLLDGAIKHCIQVIEQDGVFGCIYEVDPKTVCQYTGMTDKNGVKIFEGDILKIIEEVIEWTGYVIFCNGCFSAQEFDGGNYPALDMVLFDGTVEVIGNIHDEG